MYRVNIFSAFGPSQATLASSIIVCENTEDYFLLHYLRSRLALVILGTIFFCFVIQAILYRSDSLNSSLDLS